LDLYYHLCVALHGSTIYRPIKSSSLDGIYTRKYANRSDILKDINHIMRMQMHIHFVGYSSALNYAVNSLSYGTSCFNFNGMFFWP